MVQLDNGTAIKSNKRDRTLLDRGVLRCMRNCGPECPNTILNALSDAAFLGLRRGSKMQSCIKMPKFGLGLPFVNFPPSASCCPVAVAVSVFSPPAPRSVRHAASLACSNNRGRGGSGEGRTHERGRSAIARKEGDGAGEADVADGKTDRGSEEREKERREKRAS